MPGPSRVNDLVKFDSRTIDLSPPMKRHHSFMGTFFKAVSALATPAWFFPGVGTAIGAGTMSLGILGDHMNRRALRYETTGAAPYVASTYPGLGPSASIGSGGSGGGGYDPAALSSDPALSIITARTASMNEMPQAIGGPR